MNVRTYSTDELVSVEGSDVIVGLQWMARALVEDLVCILAADTALASLAEQVADYRREIGELNHRDADLMRERMDLCIDEILRVVGRDYGKIKLTPTMARLVGSELAIAAAKIKVA